uniref:Uncharacterized protein n=1 Tax=Solanum lycopersicum TaxID=4081 RepID=A0A3Q7J732_SOLLC
MEEEKAAAYYDELTRKGEGAARFKQGLGFSSTSNDAVPIRGSALGFHKSKSRKTFQPEKPESKPQVKATESKPEQR